MQTTRRDKLIQEAEGDPYRARAKPAEPTFCPDCRAVFRSGRWRWGDPPADAGPSVCPACQRVRDDYPAGIVTLRGDFVAPHREEIVGLARNVEAREKPEHPLKRIMDVRDEDDALVIRTTDLRLARSIGDALHSAYEGELDYQYTEGGNVLRVEWNRSD